MQTGWWIYYCRFFEKYLGTLVDKKLEMRWLVAQKCKLVFIKRVWPGGREVILSLCSAPVRFRCTVSGSGVLISVKTSKRLNLWKQKTCFKLEKLTEKITWILGTARFPDSVFSFLITWNSMVLDGIKCYLSDTLQIILYYSNMNSHFITQWISLLAWLKNISQHIWCSEDNVLTKAGINMKF